MSDVDTVLVTGGAGFIGSHIVDALLAQRYLVRVLDDLSTGSLDNIAHCRDKVDFVEGSIVDYDVVRQACEGARAVIHQAAIASVPKTIDDPIGSHAVNVTGSLNVFTAAQDANVERVVYASSAAVYGASEVVPKTEDMPVDPQSPYAAHKYINELYAKVASDLHGLTTIGLRYFNVFGPRQDPSSPYSGVISVFVDRMRSGEPITIFGDGEQTRDFIYVADVVAANVGALTAGLDSGSAHVCNIATGNAQSLNTLFETAASITQYNQQPSYADVRAGDVRHSCADVTRAQELLGIVAQTPFIEGLATTIASIRK